MVLIRSEEDGVVGMKRKGCSTATIGGDRQKLATNHEGIGGGEGRKGKGSSSNNVKIISYLERVMLLKTMLLNLTV